MTAGTDLPSPEEGPPATEGAGAGRSGIRPMARADIPAVEAIFRTAFARGRPTGDLAAYIETVFFGSPHYSEEHGSIVYDDGRKGVTAALLSLPMPFVAHDRPVMARLLCAFMSDGTKGGMLGAARLARSLRAGQVEFCFSDNASPVSADHWVASGGIALPVESLEWRRAFQPLGALLCCIGRTRAGQPAPVVAPLLRALDRAILARKPLIRPAPAPGCAARDAAPQAFLDHARAMTERFAVRPVWTQDYFDWLLGIVAMNRALGPLRCRTVEEAGRTIGVFLFAGRPGATARVLNLICEEGREFDVTAQMFASLAEEGYVDAAGMAQPFMVNAVMRQRRLTFRHRGYLCLNTRHGELLESARRGDLYIGGLASESWSRLVTDF